MARACSRDVPGVDRVTARDPQFVAALRGRVAGKVREAEPVGRYSTYRIGGPATVLLPASFGGRGSRVDACCGRGRTVVYHRPWVQHPLARRGPGCPGHPHGEGARPVVQSGDLWTIGAGLPAPLAARRTAEAGFAGLHIFVGVPGTAGRGRLHECRLSRRRLGRSG